MVNKERERIYCQLRELNRGRQSGKICEGEDKIENALVAIAAAAFWEGDGSWMDAAGCRAVLFFNRAGQDMSISQ